MGRADARTLAIKLLIALWGWRHRYANQNCAIRYDDKSREATKSFINRIKIVNEWEAAGFAGWETPRKADSNTRQGPCLESACICFIPRLLPTTKRLDSLIRLWAGQAVTRKRFGSVGPPCYTIPGRDWISASRVEGGLWLRLHPTHRGRR